MLKIKKEPKIKALQKLHLSKLKKEKLDNGLVLYYLESQAAEIVKLDVIFNAGSDIENQALTANFANNLIKEATKTQNSEEIAELFDYYGSSIANFVTNDKSGLRLNAPFDFFAQIFPVFADLILNPSLPEKEFELLKKRYIENLKNSEQQTSYQAQTNINALIFGNENSRGRLISQKDVEDLKLEHLKSYISNYYIAKNCFIFVVGANIKNVIKSVKDYFVNPKIENWNKNLCLKPAKKNLIFSKSMEKYKFIKVENAVQSTVCIAKNIKNLSSDEFIKLEILNTILGGYFGSRLMKNIREKKGYTYGIYSFLTKYNDCVVLKIISDVGTDFAKETVKEIFNEIRKLCNKKLSDSELTRVVNYTQGDLLSYTDGIFSQAEFYRAMLIKNRSLQTIYQMQKILKTIDSKTIKKIAVNYLSIIQKQTEEESFFTVVAGGVE